MSKKALTKPTPAWHAEAAEMLKTQFEKINHVFLDTTRKAVWLGIFLNYIKSRGKEDKSIPHGQFQSWLEKNVPSISLSQLAVYMALGRNAAEKAKFQISGFRTFAQTGELPPPVEKLVDGKTQNQLFLEFKQSEDDEDGEAKPKRGRLKGQGGASKEQRAAAAEAEAQAEIEAMELDAEDFNRWMDKVDDLKGFPRVNDKVFDKHLERVQAHYNFLRSVKESRKGGAR